MKVRLRSTMAGPYGIIQAGAVADLPGELARELIRTKQADAAPTDYETPERAEDTEAEGREKAHDPPHDRLKRQGRRPPKGTK